MTPRNKTAFQAMAAAMIISTLSTAPQAQAAEGDFVVIGHFYPAAGSEADVSNSRLSAARPQVFLKAARVTLIARLA